MMIDVDHVKARVDITEIIGRRVELKKAGRVWKGLCPFHSEKTPSFTVYPETQSYHCFGCEASGDVVGFVMQLEGLGFKEACEYLGAVPSAPSHPPQSPATPLSPPGHPPQSPHSDGGRLDVLSAPGEEWQERARAVINRAVGNLWGDGGERALDYFRIKRGLSDDIISQASLGYVPGDYRAWVEMEGMRVPCGVVIPWLALTPYPLSHRRGGETQPSAVWQVKVRRAAGVPKYVQVAGGSTGSLYGIDGVSAMMSVVVVEGEIDALTINQQGGFVRAVALGSASNGIHPQWIDALMFSRRLWVCMDADPAGKKAANRLMGMSRRFKPLVVPEGYTDVNDFWIQNPDGFREWLTELE